jgi:hypothetical protein
VTGLFLYQQMVAGQWRESSFAWQGFQSSAQDLGKQAPLYAMNLRPSHLNFHTHRELPVTPNHCERQAVHQQKLYNIKKTL